MTNAEGFTSVVRRGVHSAIPALLDEMFRFGS